MEIKILCGCGTKYKFEVEPVNGRMPVPVQCPNCGNNGTLDANQQIAALLGHPPPATPPAATVVPRVRLARAAVPNAGGQSETAFVTLAAAGGARPLLQRTSFSIKERVAALKLTDTYDILDPATSQPIGIAKEEPPTWAKWLRLVVQEAPPADGHQRLRSRRPATRSLDPARVHPDPFESQRHRG